MDPHCHSNDPTCSSAYQYLSSYDDAEENKVPIEVVELREGVHGFDSEQDTMLDKDMFQKVLDFFEYFAHSEVMRLFW
jgi:hypothetical protein